jgi:hypothetical protein
LLPQHVLLFSLSQHLLAQHGITLNSNGLVANRQKYHDLLHSQPLPPDTTIAPTPTTTLTADAIATANDN